MADGILEREPDPGHAGRHLYRLTAAGRELWPVLHALVVWGNRHRGPASRRFTHAACGTPLDDDGGCSRCGLAPPAGDIVAEPLRLTGRSDPVAAVLREPHRLLDPISPAG